MNKNKGNDNTYQDSSRTNTPTTLLTFLYISIDADFNCLKELYKIRIY